MTVQKDVTKNIYVGNGSTRTFPFTFECPAEHPEYIKVYLMQDDGTALATSDYQLDMDARQITYPSSGTALPEGKKLVIMRELPLQQMMNLVNNGPYFAEDVETAFDENVMAMQQIAEKLNRSIIMSVDIDGDAFVNEVPFEAGKSFRIADDGKSIVLTEDPARVLPLAQEAYAQTQAQAQIASASAAAAAKSEDSAFESAGVAGNSAGEAKTYKDNAKTYMDNAKNYSENVNVFTPSVSADGVLSWTNKAELENPTSVNIKGEKGDKGDTGAAGSAATIRIGTVTTGAPGSEAVVTNVGTANDAVFNFTLPRGEKGADGGIDIDTALSDTSTNPVQNKVIKSALDGYVKQGTSTNLISNRNEVNFVTKDAVNYNNGEGFIYLNWRFSDNTMENENYIQKYFFLNGAGKSGLASVVAKEFIGNATSATKATQDGDGNVISTTYAKVSEENKWSEQQYFKVVKLGYEKYISSNISGTVHVPSTSIIHYVATGAFTLNLSNIVDNLKARESTVFTAYIESSADYPLTITNAGAIKYIGSASDVAITGAGLLLNILMMKDESNTVTSIVQASKLEGGA